MGRWISKSYYEQTQFEIFVAEAFDLFLAKPFETLFWRGVYGFYLVPKWQWEGGRLKVVEGGRKVVEGGRKMVLGP